MIIVKTHPFFVSIIKLRHKCCAHFFFIVTAGGTGRGGSDFREHYLGPLYPLEEYKM